MSEEVKQEVGACSAIEQAKVHAQIEVERDERRFKHKVFTITLSALIFGGLMLLGGGMYGWLFLGKDFLEGPVGGFFSAMSETLKLLFGS